MNKKKIEKLYKELLGDDYKFFDSYERDRANSEIQHFNKFNKELKKIVWNFSIKEFNNLNLPFINVRILEKNYGFKVRYEVNLNKWEKDFIEKSYYIETEFVNLEKTLLFAYYVGGFLQEIIEIMWEKDNFKYFVENCFNNEKYDKSRIGDYIFKIMENALNLFENNFYYEDEVFFFTHEKCFNDYFCADIKGEGKTNIKEIVNDYVDRINNKNNKFNMWYNQFFHDLLKLSIFVEDFSFLKHNNKQKLGLANFIFQNWNGGFTLSFNINSKSEMLNLVRCSDDDCSVYNVYDDINDFIKYLLMLRIHIFKFSY